jgi:hypothetical protein
MRIMRITIIMMMIMIMINKGHEVAAAFQFDGSTVYSKICDKI